MAITDQAAQVRAHVLASLEKQALGQDYGFDVGLATLMTGPGQVAVLYQVIITQRNPLLGQPPLCNVCQIAAPAPTAEQVDEAVTAGLRSLRDLAAKVLSGGNGHAAQAIPGR